MNTGFLGHTGAAVQLVLGEKPARVFRFLWVSKTGPRIRVFTNIHSFSGYVGEVRKLCGSECVEFRSPVLAVGVLP